MAPKPKPQPQLRLRQGCSKIAVAIIISVRKLVLASSKIAIETFATLTLSVRKVARLRMLAIGTIAILYDLILASKVARLQGCACLRLERQQPYTSLYQLARLRNLAQGCKVAQPCARLRMLAIGMIATLYQLARLHKLAQGCATLYQLARLRKIAQGYCVIKIASKKIPAIMRASQSYELPLRKSIGRLKPVSEQTKTPKSGREISIIFGNFQNYIKRSFTHLIDGI